jgi:hypothetical protein
MKKLLIVTQQTILQDREYEIEVPDNYNYNPEDPENEIDLWSRIHKIDEVVTNEQVENEEITLIEEI